MPKRFLLFTGYDYYPEGGWKDFCGSFDVLLDAHRTRELRHSSCDWWHIVDLELGSIVAKNPSKHHED